MQRSLIDQRYRKAMPSVDIEKKLLKDEVFTYILENLTLYVNDSKKIVICDNNNIELPEERLLKIFSIMNSILEVRFNYTENLNTLKEILWQNLDDLDIDRITERKKELDLLEKDPDNIEFKVTKVIEDLEKNNFEYITYGQIVKALKDNFNLSISPRSNSLSKFLKDLGYTNKRITKDNKKIRVWVKDN